MFYSKYSIILDFVYLNYEILCEKCAQTQMIWELNRETNRENEYILMQFHKASTLFSGKILIEKY